MHFTERLDAYHFVLSCSGGIVVRNLVENLDHLNVTYPIRKVLDLNNCIFTYLKKVDVYSCNIFRTELNKRTSSYIFDNP